MIIVYDVTNGESFANVKRWLQEIEHNCDVVNKVLGKSLSLSRFSFTALFPLVSCRFFVLSSAAVCEFYFLGKMHDVSLRVWKKVTFFLQMWSKWQARCYLLYFGSIACNFWLKNMVPKLY